MTYRRHTTIYGRRHIHNHVRSLCEWKKKINPSHTLSEEFDILLQAGIKAVYGQDVPLENSTEDASERPPTPAEVLHV